MSDLSTEKIQMRNIDWNPSRISPRRQGKSESLILCLLEKAIAGTSALLFARSGGHHRSTSWHFIYTSIINLKDVKMKVNTDLFLDSVLQLLSI
jgi:hypothetical protein